MVGYALTLRVDNESLWLFVRMVIADGVPEVSAGMHELLAEWLNKRAGDVRSEERVLEERVRQTMHCIARYDEPDVPAPCRR
jgi:hypothetical protein